MRLNQRNQMTYHLKKQVSKKNNEGSSYMEYGDPFAFMAEIWSAEGRIQAEMYGERLSYILNMICEPFDIHENDGVCIYVDKESNPDYKVISIKHYADRKHPHLVCELEKLK